MPGRARAASPGPRGREGRHPSSSSVTLPDRDLGGSVRCRRSRASGRPGPGHQSPRSPTQEADHMAARRAVVTGASSGIGAATVRLFRSRGWDVLAVARRAAKLEALAAETGADILVADITERRRRRGARRPRRRARRCRRPGEQRRWGVRLGERRGVRRRRLACHVRGQRDRHEARRRRAAAAPAGPCPRDRGSRHRHGDEHGRVRGVRERWRLQRREVRRARPGRRAPARAERRTDPRRRDRARTW